MAEERPDDKPEAGGSDAEPDGEAVRSVDEGWKAEARAEKDELQEKLREEADEAHARKLPPAEFMPFVSGIAVQALMQLGEIEHPVYGKKMVDLESARYSIDIIGVLEEKTKGNLSDEESHYIQSALHDLRLRYVAAATASAEAAASEGAEGAEGAEPGKA